MDFQRRVLLYPFLNTQGMGFSVHPSARGIAVKKVLSPDLDGVVMPHDFVIGVSGLCVFSDECSSFS